MYASAIRSSSVLHVWEYFSRSSCPRGRGGVSCLSTPNIANTVNSIPKILISVFQQEINSKAKCPCPEEASLYGCKTHRLAIYHLLAICSLCSFVLLLYISMQSLAFVLLPAFILCLHLCKTYVCALRYMYLVVAHHCVHFISGQMVPI